MTGMEFLKCLVCDYRSDNIEIFGKCAVCGGTVHDDEDCKLECLCCSKLECLCCSKLNCASPDCHDTCEKCEQPVCNDCLKNQRCHECRNKACHV